MGWGHDGPDADLLRRLVDRLPGMVAYWSSDLHLVIANAAYCTFMGRPIEELRGQHFSTVLGEAVYRANQPLLAAALAGEPQVFERTLTDGHGVTRHTEVSYSPDHVGGRIEGIFALITDITARVEAQADLDEAQQIAGLASWTLRPDDGTLTWSRQLFRLTGQDPDRDTADWSTYLQLVHPDDRPVVEAARAEAARGLVGEMRHRLVVDGEIRHVRSRGRVVLDAHGHPLVVRGTLQDETDLMRQARALDTANRHLADLIAMIGHDVRQPLGVVIAYLDEVIDQWGRMEPPALEAYVAKAFGAARRMDQMLDDILAMINPDSDAVVVHPRRVPLADEVAAALAEETYALAPRLEVGGDADVVVDPFHLRRILGNLLSNAARYGAEPVTVAVGATEGDVLLRVTDSGPGVPDDFVPRLFDRFARAAASTAAAPTGTGFGLYLVRELVQANGGTIGYQPATPTGAQFTVTFPRVTT